MKAHKNGIVLSINYLRPAKHINLFDINKIDTLIALFMKHKSFLIKFDIFKCHINKIINIIIHRTKTF